MMLRTALQRRALAAFFLPSQSQSLYGFGALFFLSACAYLLAGVWASPPPESWVSEFWSNWQLCFHPLQLLLLKWQAFMLPPEWHAGVSPSAFAQTPWYWLLLFVFTDLLAVVAFIAAIDVLAQKVFALQSRIGELLRYFLCGHILLSLVLGVPLFMLSAQARFSPNAIFLLVGLLATLGLVYCFRKVYRAEQKNAWLLGALVVPLFPLAAILLAVFAVLELPIIRAHADNTERGLRTWLQLLHTPQNALERAHVSLAPGLALALAAALGALGVFVLTQYDRIQFLYPQVTWLWWGFSGLFHKTELAAHLYVVGFDLARFGLMFFSSHETYFFVFSFVVMFVTQAALVDFTAWTLFKRNRSFATVLGMMAALAAAAMALFGIFSYAAWLLAQFAERLSGVSLHAATPGFAGVLTLALAIWLVRLQIHAFRKIYTMDQATAILLWLASLIFLPLSLAVLLYNALVELASLITTGQRKKNLRHHLAQLQEIDANTPLQIANTRIETFAKRLSERSLHNLIARREIEMDETLTHLVRHQPKTVIIEFLNMAEGEDPEIKADALRWLASLFTLPAKSHTRLFYYILERRIAPATLEAISNLLPAEHVWRALFSDYGRLLQSRHATTSTQDLQERIAAHYQKLSDDPLAPEFAHIYRGLATLSGLRNIHEIALLEERIRAYMQLERIEEEELLGVFKLYLRLSNYQNLYERLVDENKMPFLSTQMSILVDLRREIGALNAREVERSLLQAATERVQEWVQVLIKQQRGEIKLEVELKTKKMPAADRHGTVVVQLSNIGTGLAQNIRLSLQAKARDRYHIAGEAALSALMLEPRASHIFEFVIEPLTGGQAGPQRLPFLVEYEDVENQKFSFEHGDNLEFTGQETIGSGAQLIGDIVNPYIAGPAVHEPKMFFGRQQEFENIRVNLQGQHQDNIVVVFGQRRSGKSSMLLQMEKHLGSDRYVCAYIDLQGVESSNDTATFIHRLATVVYRQLHERGIALARPMPADFASGPLTHFREHFLPEIFDQIPGRRLLLMLDEFEEIETRIKAGHLDPGLLNSLRSLMQHEQRLSFILSGAHRLHELTSDYWSTLFNITRYVKIGFLDRQSSERLICEPVAEHVTYDPLAVNKILDATACQPYFIQLLCLELFNKFKRDNKNYLTVQDVNQALQAVIASGSGQFDFIWTKAAPLERLVLAAVADLSGASKDRVTLSAMGQRLKNLYVRVEEMQLREALNHLVDIEVLNANEQYDSFIFPVDLMRLWLKAEKPLIRTIEQFKQ